MISQGKKMHKYEFCRVILTGPHSNMDQCEQFAFERLSFFGCVCECVFSMNFSFSFLLISWDHSGRWFHCRSEIHFLLAAWRIHPINDFFPLCDMNLLNGKCDRRTHSHTHTKINSIVYLFIARIQMCKIHSFKFKYTRRVRHTQWCERWIKT